MADTSSAQRPGPLRPRDLALISLSAALIAVCAWLSVPLTVPFTMQTFAVCLCAALLGRRRALLTLACYTLLGAAGVPVFSGFRGGLGVLLGNTGGYILGFFFTALVVGAAADRLGRSRRVLIPAMALGILLCYAFGTAWFAFLYIRGTGPIGLGTVLAWCVLPYIPADTAKLLLAAFLAVRLYPVLERGRSYD